MQIQADQKAGWQKLGSIKSEYVTSGCVINASGTWCFNAKERDARTCNPDGQGNRGNYYVMHVANETSYILHDAEAVLGELVGRIGTNGEPFRIGKSTSIYPDNSDVGKDIWVSMNHGWYTVNSDGAIDVTLRVRPDPLPDPVQAGKERQDAYAQSHVPDKEWKY